MAREEILCDIARVIHEIVGNRGIAEVRRDSQLVRDLSFESIEYVFLVERLSAMYSLNFAEWLGSLDPREIEALRICDIVEFIASSGTDQLHANDCPAEPIRLTGYAADV